MKATTNWQEVSSTQSQTSSIHPHAIHPLISIHPSFHPSTHISIQPSLRQEPHDGAQYRKGKQSRHRLYRAGATIGLQNHTTSVNPKPESNIMRMRCQSTPEIWFSICLLFWNLILPGLTHVYNPMKAIIIYVTRDDFKIPFHHYNNRGVVSRGIRIYCYFYAKSTKKLLRNNCFFFGCPLLGDVSPPFLHHPEIYNLEFWHAHLNYACTRFSTSHGSDRLLGNQICHWTMGTSETCMKVTHLVVFFATGSRRLCPFSTPYKGVFLPQRGWRRSHARWTTYPPHFPKAHFWPLLPLIPHQAEQIANARRSAAQGSLEPYTIPSCWHPDTVE